MATLANKIKLYLEANSKTWENEQNNIKLRNDGSGDYIHTWSVSGLDKPTDSQVASYETQATKDENNYTIRVTRKRAYGDIGDQLDDLYAKGAFSDDMAAKIKAVKDKHPKS